MIVLQEDDIFDVLDLAMVKILRQIVEFQQKGSGWIVRRVLHLDIHISKYMGL